MCPVDNSAFVEDYVPENLAYHTIRIAVVSQTDRPSRSSIVMQAKGFFGCVFVLSLCAFDFSVDIRDIVIGLSQKSSLFYW